MKLLIEKVNEKVTVETTDLNKAMTVLKYMVEGGVTEVKPSTTTINIPTPVTNPPILDIPERKDIFAKPIEPRPLTRKLETLTNATRPSFIDRAKSDKQLIFFKCKECGTVGCTHQNPNDPIKCYHCQQPHTLEPLVAGSYYCECGKICKFVQEESVSVIKCHTCDVEHLMVYSEEENRYKSLQSVEVSHA